MDSQSLRTCIDTRLATRPDPLGVLKTTAPLVLQANVVTIDQKRLPALASLLAKRIKGRNMLTENQFQLRRPPPQAVLIIDTVNFSFWPSAGEKKWHIEYPPGNVADGWEGLCAAFRRADDESIPVFDASYLSTISLKDVRHMFRGKDGTTLPLLEKRHEFLQETGRVLREKFGGNASNLIKQARYQAPAIAQLVIDHFSSFRDEARWENKMIHFYKRAQIVAYDTSSLPNTHIIGLENLTIFADYKLPQILRHHGLLVYEPSLAKRVDAKQELAQGSREELEIRAATIWACEMLAAEQHHPACVIDNALWVLSQEAGESLAPYHRTRTKNY